MKRFAQEGRVYRLRCVEGWSMVIPWRGFPLAALLNECMPTSRAKFVEFVSVLRPQEMIGQRLNTLRWPYTEALRIDEATHPLHWSRLVFTASLCPISAVLRYAWQSPGNTDLKVSRRLHGYVWSNPLLLPPGCRPLVRSMASLQM